jgi:hypothetical protein
LSLGARAGLGQTYKRILFDNDELLAACAETEGKTIKYWNACTEKLMVAPEDGVAVEGLEEYSGDPMPHLLIYLKGDLKATINVRSRVSAAVAPASVPHGTRTPTTRPLSHSRRAC